MKFETNALPMITLGNERDPNASIAVIEVPALWGMQNRMMGTLQVALAHGAEISLISPDHFGYLALTASGSMDTGYFVQSTVMQQGAPITTTLHRNTAAATLRTLCSFATGSTPFDFEAK